MAYDETLAARVRDALALEPNLTERKMFGGLAFMVGGNMCCGIVKDELMVRVPPDDYAAALTEPHARAMDFTGRPMKGMLFVAPAGLAADADLRTWVTRGAVHARSLPPK